MGYGPAMRCPVLVQCTVMPICYAMSGTDKLYAPRGLCRRVRYWRGAGGTEILYGATTLALRDWRYKFILRYHMVLCDVQYRGSICWYNLLSKKDSVWCCATRGTET
eukprot:2036135-Rhodomonas_salina.1